MKKLLTLVLSALLILNTVFITPIHAVADEEEPIQEVAEEEILEEVPEVVEEVEETPTTEEETLLGEEEPLTYHMDQIPYRVEVYEQVRNQDDYGNITTNYVLYDTFGGTVNSPTVFYADSEYDPSSAPKGHHLVNGNLVPGIMGLTYIETDGTQYINTGIYPDQNTYVYSRFQLVNESKDYQTLFGVTDPDDALFNFTFGARHDDSNYSKLEYKYGIGRNAVNEQIERFADVDIHDIELSAYGLTLDDQYYEPIDVVGTPDFDFETETDDGELYLFANNVDGAAKNKGSYRLYHMSIYDGEELVREYYPGVVYAYDSVKDQYGEYVVPFTVGLYDAVEDQFYIQDRGNDFGHDYLPFAYLEGGEYQDDIPTMRLFYDIDNVVVWYQTNDEEGTYAWQRYYAGDELDLMPEFLEEYYENDTTHNIGKTLKRWDCLALNGLGAFDGGSLYLNEKYYVDEDFIEAAEPFSLVDGPAYYYNKRILFEGVWEENQSLISVKYNCVPPIDPIQYWDGDSWTSAPTEFSNFYIGGIFDADNPQFFRIKYPNIDAKPGYRFDGWDIYGLKANTYAYFDINADNDEVQNITSYNIDNVYGYFDEDKVYHSKAYYDDPSSYDNGYDAFWNLNPSSTGIIKFVARWVSTGDLVNYDVNVYREFIPEIDISEDIDVWVNGIPYIQEALPGSPSFGAPVDSFVYAPEQLLRKAETYIESSSIDGGKGLLHGAGLDAYESVEEYFIDVDEDTIGNELRKVESITSYPYFADDYEESGYQSICISPIGQSIDTGLKTKDVYKVDMDVQTIGSEILSSNPYLFFGDNAVFNNIDDIINELKEELSHLDLSDAESLESLENNEVIENLINFDLSKLNYLNSGFTYVSGSLTDFSPVPRPPRPGSLSKMNIFGCGNMNLFSSALIKGESEYPVEESGFNADYLYNIVAERNNNAAQLYVNDTKVTEMKINNLSSDGEFYLFGMDDCIDIKDLLLASLRAEEGPSSLSEEELLVYLEMIAETIPMYKTLLSSIGLYGYYTLYGAKIYNEENELIRNYVPCVTVENLDAEFVSEGRDVEPGTYGLYDEVEGIFYPCVNEEQNFKAGVNLREYDDHFYSGSAGYVAYDDTDINIFLQRKEATIYVLDVSEAEIYKQRFLGEDYLVLHNDTIYDGDPTSIFEDEDYDHDLYYLMDNGPVPRLYRLLDSYKVKVGDPIYEPEKNVRSDYMFYGWAIDAFEYNSMETLEITDWSEYINNRHDGQPFFYTNVNRQEFFIGQMVAPTTVAPRAELVIDENNVLSKEVSTSEGNTHVIYSVAPGTQIGFKSIPDAEIVYRIDDSNMPSVQLYDDPIEIDRDCAVSVSVFKDNTINQSVVTGLFNNSVSLSELDVTYEFKVVYGDEETRSLIRLDYQRMMSMNGVIPSGIWVGSVDYENGGYYKPESKIYYDPTVKEYKPKLRVYYHYTLLTEGVDYTVKYSNNKNATTTEKPSIATITGKGNYSGKVHDVYFVITPLRIDLSKSLEAEQITEKVGRTRVVSVIPEYSDLVFKYNGKAQKPKLKSLTIGVVSYETDRLNQVVLEEVTYYKLKENKDYIVDYEYPNSTNINSYQWRIVGKGNYNGSMLLEDYEITDNQLVKNLKISGIKDVNFFDINTNNNFTFAENGLDTLVIKDSKTSYVLQEGLDYELTYYYSEVNPFEIDSRKKAVESAGAFDKLFTDYIPANRIRVNGYNVMIRGIGDYSGYIIKSFKIKGIDMSKVKYSKLDSSYPYANGIAVTPTQTLTYNGMKLNEFDKETGSVYYEYVAEYANNINPGTATITYIGNPYRGFTGTKTVKFKIKGASLSTFKNTEYEKAKDIYYVANKDVEFINSTALRETAEGYYDYVVSPYYTNKVSGITQNEYLNPENHYTVEYVNNNKAGTAKVIYTGVNAYYGSTLTKSFKINSYPIDSDPYELMEIIGLDEVQEYEKGGTRVNIRIYQGNYKLKEGVDYKLTYKKNDVVSTLDRYGEPNPDSYVTIKGIGNFSGTIEKKFAIKTKDISKCDMKALDIVANFEDQNSFETNVVITDTNGKELKAGKDFGTNFIYYYANDTLVKHNGELIVRHANEEVSHYDIVFPGTEIRVETTGIGNYEGIIQTTYRVGEDSLANAKVTVRKQYYTGSAINVIKDDITVMVNGVELYPHEFDIIDYTNNTKKGNSATITIRGKNGFVGEITAKFSIVARPMDSYIVRFYGRDQEERYNIDYPYHISTIKGTMDDLVIKSTKLEMKLPKCKYKYVIDDDGDIFEKGIEYWYCSELDEPIPDEITLTNNMMYYMNCNGGVIHLYANYFPHH